MSLTEAMQEAYAANPAGEVVYETLEFDHSTFVEPLRVITGVEKDTYLPLALGQPNVLFRAVAIAVIPPGVSEDGPTPMRIRVDNVASVLLPYLQDAVQSTDPIKVTYRAYTTLDLTQPGDVISDLELRQATMTPTMVEASIGFREIELQAFPLATYDEQYYPALQQS